MNQLTQRRLSLYMPLMLFFYSLPIFALDRNHFYSTVPRWQEARFIKDKLFSADFSFYEGNAKTKEKCGECTDGLLDLYGTYNMHLLGQNVPGKDLTTNEDTILTLLALLPSRDQFGHLSFDATFQAQHAEITFSQNFKHGFFTLLHIPIRTLEIDKISYKDLSPSGPDIPNKNTVIWKAFLADFETILNKYDLDIASFRASGVGDISWMIGWTDSNQNTEILDFVDTTVKVGVLFPSGKKKNQNQVFSLPLGYDNHVGIPVAFDIALGTYDWLTIGAHLDALFLCNKTKTIRMKTDTEQSGMIKLAQGNARVSPGAHVKAGIYCKADHFTEGLSADIGYSYSVKTDDCITPCNTERFSTAVVNSDDQFKKWDMHTIHFGIDYDFAKETWRVGPKIGFFYNWHVGGKRTFKTNSFGGTLGIDIQLDF